MTQVQQQVTNQSLTIPQVDTPNTSKPAEIVNDWQARRRLLFLFALLGLVFAAWAARIPTIRDKLDLSTGQLGLALLCAGIGGLASFPFASTLVARWGPAKAALCSGSILLMTLISAAFSPTLPILMSALGLMGASASCFDVAINAIGTIAEAKAGRSIMSLLHAGFCVGTVVGSLSGSALASLGWTPQAHFMLIAAMFALPLWLACRFLQARLVPVAAALVSTSTHRRWFNLPTRPLMILGLIGFCGAIVEGGIADWSGVFMQDKLNATDGLAPLGYAGFAGAMLIARLYADRLKDHFGARRVVAFGAMFAVAGMMAAVSAVSSPLTIAGFALAGAGLSGVFPFVFSAAGRHGSKALAGVATISYCGGLIGPPVIGFIGQLTDLSIALGCVGLLCALLGCVAYRCASLA